MRFNAKSIIIAGGVAALSLSIVGCHGQTASGSGYMPPSATVLPASQARSAMEPHAKTRRNSKSSL
jgi:hypothetical protein